MHFILIFFHISTTKIGDRATKDCPSSHFQGHKIRAHSKFEFLGWAFKLKYVQLIQNGSYFFLFILPIIEQVLIFKVIFLRIENDFESF